MGAAADFVAAEAARFGDANLRPLVALQEQVEKFSESRCRCVVYNVQRCVEFGAVLWTLDTTGCLQFIQKQP